MTDNENKIKELEERISKLEALIQDRPVKVIKEVSIKEFLLSKNLKNDMSKTLAICYYSEKYNGMDSINVKDVEAGFQNAKERVPEGNIAYKLFMLVKKGYLMEYKEKKNNLKSYVLTNSGEKFIEEELK